MTTTNPEPEAPAKPVITLTAGVYYGPGAINWLTPEVVALAPTCNAGETLKVSAVYFSGLDGSLGLRDDNSNWILLHGLYSNRGEICGYPIKVGDYNLTITAGCYSEDDDGRATWRASTHISAILRVGGDDQASACDRDVLNHFHPGTAEELKRTNTNWTNATIAAHNRADEAYKRADTALANAANIKEIADSHSNSIGQLWQRLLAVEAKIAEDED